MRSPWFRIDDARHVDCLCFNGCLFVLRATTSVDMQKCAIAGATAIRYFWLLDPAGGVFVLAPALYVPSRGAFSLLLLPKSGSVAIGDAGLFL
jgi:hypothetical protein